MWNLFRRYGAILEVYVSDAIVSNVPIGKAKVEVTGYMSGAGRKTDGKGKARFTNRRPGTYTIKVAHPDYFSCLTQVTLGPGERKKIDILLEPRAFKGYVLDKSGDPASGMLVTLTMPGRDYRGETDDDGQFNATTFIE